MSATATPANAADRLSFTLFLALAIHAVLIFGLSFASELAAPAPDFLEVTLAHQPSTQAPDQADFIAQANQEGSGSLDEAREVTTDQISPFQDHQHKEVNLTPPSAKQASQASRLMITSISNSSFSAPTDEGKSERKDRPLPPSDQDNVKPLSQDISTLEARLAQQKQAYAKRPRYKFVDSSSAVASVEALYINAFRREVEAMGTRNFPAEALQNHIFGNVRLRVDIAPDGKVKQIKLLKSSGFELLDHAAMQSVKLAAPFAPFTAEMREHYASNDYNMLAIIRTWKFDSSSTLTTSY